ncbi:vesicle transport protein SFT2A isoform X3 [Hydra vulgaris]|uniref:Vesicle transport protein n=1 Tax=Hydra vulgaris TaxID=6087 RepID=A0ABM4BH44_HYDVU
MDKIKRTISGKQDDEAGIVAETSPLMQISDATTLSWSTRIKCFIACFLFGISFSILGAFLFFKSLKLFGVFYTFGNIASLASTCFLMGPLKQLKNMFKEKRLIATIVMLGALTLTLCSAFWWNKKGLVLLFVVIQYFAMTWYCLSYIPFARDAVKKCIESCLG